MPEGTCSIEGCEKPVFGRGWCRQHWQGWRDVQPGRLQGPRRSTCTADGCGKPHSSRGYCTMHLSRLRRSGKLTTTRRHVRTGGPCAVDGCDRVEYGRGWCGMHYQRWRKHGSTDQRRAWGDNRFEDVDLITGRLVVVRPDGSEHASLYDMADDELLRAHRWFVSRPGYIATKLTGPGRSFKLLHRMIVGLGGHGDKRWVDHINGDRLDNRRENLRVASSRLNSQNRAIINELGTSKYRGVCWVKERSRWKAYTHVNGRAHNLGYYKTEREAADVVIAFRAVHHLDSGYLRRHAHTPSVAQPR